MGLSLSNTSKTATYAGNAIRRTPRNASTLAFRTVPELPGTGLREIIEGRYRSAATRPSEAPVC
jgi:hypothetical protein